MAFNKEAALARARSKKPAAKPKGPKAAKESPELTAEESAYRQRAKAEQDRRKLATDGDFECVLCFHDAAEREEFKGLFPDIEWVRGRYCFNEELRAGLEGMGVKLAKGYRQTPRVWSDAKAENPVMSAEPCEDPEEMTVRQYCAIRDAFGSRENAEHYSCVYDSPYWVCVISRCMADRDQLLRDYGWLRWGNHYCDGSKVLKELNRA